MNIRVICVGKLKERYFTDTVSEYLKRLGAYASVEIVEIMDEPAPERSSEAMAIKVKRLEGERIISRIKPRERVIALTINGKKYSSEDFALHLEKLMVDGVSDICFMIGGSIGLSDEVLSIADEKLSFSDMTFPHQLMRVILLEQIYRAFRIINHEPYHK